MGQLAIKTYPGNSVFSMAAKADTLKKPVKGEKLSSSRCTTSVNDNCGLCSC